MSGRLRMALAVLLLALPAAGCDLFGPSGPGTLEATVSADEPLGAMVLELRGAGVTGYAGRGETRVYGAAVSTGVHRLLIVSPSGSALRFAVEVEDLGADPPQVTVVSAVDPDNRATNALGVQIRID